MMKAAEATDSLRAPAKLAFTLPCSARELPISDKKAERTGESFTSCPSGTASRLPNSHALADANSKGPLAGGTPADYNAAPRNQVLANLMQTGGAKSRGAPLASAASMERRRRCSCGELNYLSSNNAAPNGSSFHSNYGSCNCNVENCAWEEGLSAPHLKAQPWRSSSDQSNSNAALHRALAAMKKVSGEPDAVKKAQTKPIPLRNATDLRALDTLDINARSITNSDARTLSMRERGRWGNSKMQQHLFTQPTVAGVGGGGGQNATKANLSSECQHQQHHHHHHQQPLQHVQCLHCGSFSTTPVSGIAQGARSQSFGRKVRDYTWQQELLQEQKRPEPQGTAKEMPEQQAVLPQSGPQGSQNHGIQHHRCEYARLADMSPEYEQQGPAALMKVQHMHGGNVMSWQERYMLLCQAIAAGAFVDGCADDISGPILPSNRGYSWAVCECAACEMGCATAAAAPGAGFRQGPLLSSYCNTSSGERMMELEAFSGPLGYVSESKAGVELSSIMEKRGARRRWWARLPSFGKSKSHTTEAAWRAASGQNTAQCSSCGQRVWRRGEEDEELGGRLCPDCLVRAGSDKCESGPIPGTTAAARPTPPRATRRQRPPQPPFSGQQRQLPRRWRLMKLCRYLMGFPLQR
ncbi:hypothetical protein GOP47_0024170 [Adiantum capillus-veneris]|uniref:Uncharacterized protein n=1 Tax=Adiantum capillus-veneris TaxID=13818 RepID=A0A9D4U5W5_ADICA|nr:hypothetical protein GOP47_0024170 [Adiantum capillus-veneris]